MFQDLAAISTTRVLGNILWIDFARDKFGVAFASPKNLNHFLNLHFLNSTLKLLNFVRLKASTPF